MKEVCWGIIGCGNVTEVKSGPALQKAESSRLVAVMRRNQDKAADYARRHSVPKWYSSAPDLINDPDVNAVYIATPPDSHKQYTLAVAAAGKPVYVEKPMARSYNECREMIKACDAAGTPLFTAFYRRSLPRFNKVKELIDTGTIGDIRLISVVLYQPPQRQDFQKNQLPWRVLPETAGGGYFVDLAAHTLDILDYFCGPIVSAKGLAENQFGLYPAEDIVSAVFRFKSGILGSGVWCFNTGMEKDLVEIVGSKAKVRFSTFKNNPIELVTGNDTQKWEIENPPHIQQPHVQSIVNALTGRGQCPSDGVSGARTSQVIDWILGEWRGKNNISF
jgi:predicted dehydrogenase